MKIETILKMLEVPHRAIDGDSLRAPKGKLPYIEEDGTVLADSGLIAQYLGNRYGDLDEDLTNEQRMRAHALRRMLEESTIWALRYARFCREEGWRDTKPWLRSILPLPLRLFAPQIVRRGMLRDLKAQGLSRHGANHVFDLASDDVDTLASALGDNDYFFGKEPHNLDAVAHAFLANFLCDAAASPLTEATREHANLVAFTRRMDARYYA
jgi:glutathione S-transferase